MVRTSLIPRPSSSCFFLFWIHNTWKQKSSENWVRPGNAYRMTWTWGGSREAVPNYKFECNKLEVIFLLFKLGSLDLANVWGSV